MNFSEHLLYRGGGGGSPKPPRNPPPTPQEIATPSLYRQGAGGQALETWHCCHPQGTRPTGLAGSRAK